MTWENLFDMLLSDEYHDNKLVVIHKPYDAYVAQSTKIGQSWTPLQDALMQGLGKNCIPYSTILRVEHPLMQKRLMKLLI